SSAPSRRGVGRMAPGGAPWRRSSSSAQAKRRAHSRQRPSSPAQPGVLAATSVATSASSSRPETKSATPTSRRQSGQQRDSEVMVGRSQYNPNFMDLAGIQAALREQRIDGWLLYDFRGRNPIARAVIRFAGRQLG